MTIMTDENVKEEVLADYLPEDLHTIDHDCLVQVLHNKSVISPNSLRLLRPQKSR